MVLSFPCKPCTASSVKSSTLKTKSNNNEQRQKIANVNVSPNPRHRKRIVSLRLVIVEVYKLHSKRKEKIHSSLQRPETLRNEHQQLRAAVEEESCNMSKA